MQVGKFVSVPVRLFGVLWASPYTALGLLHRLPHGQFTLAFTRGYTVLGQTHAALDICREHELVHVRQFERQAVFQSGPQRSGLPLFQAKGVGSLRCGITTGTCAAAAAKAAALVLTGGSAPSQVELRLPSGSMIQVPILGVRYEPNSPATTASVCKAPVLVPGNIGARAVCRSFALRDDQVVPVGNEWGFALRCLRGYAFRAIMIAGHPGKRVKLAMHQGDTHSARSAAAVNEVRRVGEHVLGHAGADVPTVEGVMAALEANERRELGNELARRIRRAVGSQCFDHQPAETGGTEETAERHRLDSSRTAVFLVDMAGQCLGTSGDFTSWRM